jgi:hypothetical protein
MKKATSVLVLVGVALAASPALARPTVRKAAAPVVVAQSVDGAVLHDNGSIVTHPGGHLGVPGADLSMVAPDGTSAGSNVDRGAAAALADDFVVPANETWNVNKIVVFGYETGGTTGASSITQVGLEIWNGAPNAGGAMIWGNRAGNHLTTASFSNIYRCFNGDFVSTNRPVYRLECTPVGIPALQAGTYWLVQQQAGNAALTGPWGPYVGDGVGAVSTPLGNELQFFGGAWQAANNGIVGFQTIMPFIVEGTKGGGCYPDCDGNGTLNVNDYICFQTKFALGDPYADCDNNGVRNVNDYICFQTKFALGC